MRVAIAGAGSVGRSIARELIEQRPPGAAHRQGPRRDQARAGPGRRVAARRLLRAVARSRRPASTRCDVVIAATGDDKVNLVTSLLAKTEFGVPRTVARVNHPNNEWLFNEAWGVDVNVSTPRIMSALVEEAVTVGDLVRLFTFRQGNANLVELTLPADSPYVGKPVGADPVAGRRALVTILRDGQGLRARPPSSRSRPATSCCSSPRPTSRPSSRSCSHRTVTTAGRPPPDRPGPGLRRRRGRSIPARPDACRAG